MAASEEGQLSVQESVAKIADTIARLETSISAPDWLDTLDIVIAAIAAIAAAVATGFAWHSITRQSESEHRQYIWRMLDRYASSDMQRALEDFTLWTEDNADFLAKIRKNWPDYTVNADEREKMKEIGSASAMIYHFYKEIYDHYKAGFLVKDDVKKFKKLRGHDLLETEKILSKQFFKDFSPGETPKRVNDRHRWIDDLAQV